MKSERTCDHSLVLLKRPLAPPGRRFWCGSLYYYKTPGLVWFLKLLLLNPPKTGTSADRFGGPALVLHGIYIRGKATGAIFDGLATRNHKVGSFETALGAAHRRRAVLLAPPPSSRPLSPSPYNAAVPKGPAFSFLNYLWLLVALNPSKTGGASTDRFSGPAVASHGTYIRGRAI